MPKTIYKFAVVDGQEWIFPVDDEDFETFLAMDGTAILEWDPPTMRILDTDGPSYSDFPWLAEHAPILRDPAVYALESVLLGHGQILPLKGERVWLLNVTTVVDALDKERSNILYFDDGGILDIERYVFNEDVVGTAEIFKLPMRASAVYVSDSFVSKVREAGLRGVSFLPVWTDGAT